MIDFVDGKFGEGAKELAHPREPAAAASNMGDKWVVFVCVCVVIKKQSIQKRTEASDHIFGV